MVGYRRTKLGFQYAANAFAALNKKRKGQHSIKKYYKHSKSKPVVTARKITARAKKRITKSGDADNGTDSISRTIRLNNNKPVKHAKGCWKYSQFVPEVPFSNAGNQANQQFAMGTVSQITVSTGVAHNGTENQVALRLMNPNYLNTGSAYIPAAGVPTTDEFVIKTMKMELEITSWMDLCQTVDLYFYVAKNAGQDLLDIVWARGLQQQGSGKSQATKLISPLYLGVAGYGNINEPYCTPLDASEYISNQYTFKGSESFVISGGSTKKVVYNILANKKVKSSELDLAAADGSITYPGLTCIVMMVVRGQIVCDTTAALNKPTFATTRLGVICRQSYVCHPVDSPIANRTVGIHAYNLPINAATGNQALIDVNDDIDTAKPVV